MLIISTYGNTYPMFLQAEIKSVQNVVKIYKHQTHFRDVETKIKTMGVRRWSQAEALSRARIPDTRCGGSSAGCATTTPTARGNAARSRWCRGIANALWMSGCWLPYEVAQTWKHNDMIFTTVFGNTMELIKSWSLAIFASAWNNYLSRDNNLFKGLHNLTSMISHFLSLSGSFCN